MRRWIAGGTAFVIAVAALILALGGSLNHTSRHDRARRTPPHTTGATTPATTTHRTAPPPLDTHVDAGSRTPAQTALTRALDRAMQPAGPDSGAFVYDLDTRRPLYSVRAGVARPPASVEKLWTTVALLDRLGGATRLHTAVLGTGRLQRGTWHGDLYLRGGGDPTFGDPGFNRLYEHALGSTPNELVAALRRRGIRRVTGRVFADDTLFDRRRGGLITDYKPDTPDFGGLLSSLDYDHGTLAPHYSDPAAFAVHVFAQMLRNAGVSARAAVRPRRTPPSADLLAEVGSPPLSVMTRQMDVPSDDLYAELFTKQLGVLFGHGGSIAAGARVIADTIASGYGLHPRIRDGSGLGRVDRTSPLEIVQLLAAVHRTTVGRQLAASMPTVGVNGTVEGIAPKTAAKGRCIAKTGTLNAVTNLAGYCTTKGGHRIAFGLFVDGPDNATAFALEGRMLAAIARY